MARVRAIDACTANSVDPQDQAHAMSNPILPHIAKAITSPRLQKLRRARAERQRVRKGEPHWVTVYLRISDPYSYLLLQVLGAFQKRFSIEYDFRTVLSLQQDMYPAPGLWENNAFIGGAYLAELYDLKFPATRPSSTPERDAEFTAQLLHWELQPGYLDRALLLFDAYWHADDATVASLFDPGIAGHVECYQHHQQANENLLKDQGHYLHGMLHYGGEWYFGLDRLEHLERRLNELALSASPDAVHFDRGYQSFCTYLSPDQIPDCERDTPIEAYWSIRSPYSYLGLVRATKLAEHYRVPLVVKPVLPMVMRRMQVPRTKRFYIALDTKREAQKYGIDFGFIADPLGAGVERCYALYEFAVSKGKGIEFLDSYARGVWSEGIRSDTDSGLRKLVERAGLDWQQARTMLQEDSWRLWVQDNLSEMYRHGFWGVPSFRYGETKVFGQDRLDCIERAIATDLQARSNQVAETQSVPHQSRA